MFFKATFFNLHSANYFPLLKSTIYTNNNQKITPGVSNQTPIPAFRDKREIMNNEDASSCYRSTILQNVTLRGGIEAGYFRKLAEHVAMKLCVELCCEEKGCDVAFMWGKHCYGVQCFSHELCEAIPAKQNIEGPLMLSHVTFQGQKCKLTDTHSSNENYFAYFLCKFWRSKSHIISY